MNRRRDVAIAGHTGQVDTARAALSDPDPAVRATALGALQRLGQLTLAQVSAMLDPNAEPSAEVRRRAAQAAASMPDCVLLGALDDSDWSVVEMSCWAIGEHEYADHATLLRLVDLAGSHPEPIVREAAVAALGAVGDPQGLAAIIAATHDKPAIRRRAAVALAPFESPEADAALRRLLDDRDWQTRQIAEDLLDERPG